MLPHPAINDVRKTEAALRDVNEIPQLRRFYLTAEGRRLPGRQEVLRIELAENLDQEGDNAGPTRLVAGTDAGAVVAVEIYAAADDLALPRPW